MVHGTWYMVHGFDQTLELNQCDPAFSFKLKQQQEPFLTANLPSFKSLLYQNFLIQLLSQPRCENATPSSGTSPVAFYQEVPPSPLKGAPYV